ncbi:trypsin-like peptidase domain-containing protein [Streptomyces sp. NPDC012746]|uniref:trypsin-like peptidase domain-containing protein n=1 Tax=Streptomyces sp. NPDC012746 TaxID=3364845 RepID=UPI0036B9E805
MNALLSEALENTYPEAFEAAARVARGMQSVEPRSNRLLLTGRGHQYRVLSVTLTRSGKGVLPAVVVAIPVPIIRMRHADTDSKPATPIDAVLEDVFVQVRDQTDVEVSVIGVPPPMEQVAPGERAHCGVGPATYGVPVEIRPYNQRGILTAGHAAPIAGVPAYDGNAQLVGEVKRTMHCGLTAPRQETADVAVIILEATEPDGLRAAPKVSTIGTAHRWDQVTAFGARTSGFRAHLLTAGNPFVNRPDGGDWGEAAMTAYPISAPGDSGAPVYNESDELVGVIVGGYEGLYSIVQDISYQFREADVELR